MNRIQLIGFLGLLPIVSAAHGSESEALFVRRIQPLFSDKCLACHGKDSAKIKGGFDMRTLTSVLKGGDSGQAGLVPGRPAHSPVYLAALRDHDEWEPMPPKEADRLSEEQIGWIKSWIDGGAPWPDAARASSIATTNSAKWAAEDGIQVQTSGGLSDDWTQRRYKADGLWAYQPIRKPTTPGDGTRHPIDAFLEAKMPDGVPLAPAASPHIFLRRATFDATGLPPTPEEVDAFVSAIGDRTDTLPDHHVSSLIERLLASPHYGERMAQHWLDVVRYADSSGFANDYERGNAWRYRDYVVRAFNTDKPYDQFVREQIAGDELHPGDPESLIATGFLRMGPWELTGMEVAKVARQRFLDDVTNSVGETFMGHSLQCARCHDHKFDPVPTRDYYAIQAVFATTQLAERHAPFLESENVKGFEERKYLEARRAEYIATLERLDALSVVAAQAWFRDKGIDPAKWDAAVAKAQSGGRSGRTGRRREFTGLFEEARGILTKAGVPEEQFPPKLLGFSPEDFGNERVARKGLERLRWEMERYEPFALAVYNGRTPDVKSVNAPQRVPPNRLTTGELEQTCILTGGDPFAGGPEVNPGVLSVLANVPCAPIAAGIDGRRRIFADWVAHPANPLTARTIVNRIWMWHFGQPLAGNPNNLGSTGKRPSHPELLDWLAATFIETGWSFKAMHRLIMTSRAYRRSARHPDPALLGTKDPSRNSYAAFTPRRLTAEELRDAMLAVSGELNPTLGGIPNRPEINLEAAFQPRQVMGTFASAWVPNPLPSQRHRRSLYSLKLRGLADPHLEVFNAPAPDFSCERREASTVTPQVFSMFNSSASHARALAFAKRAIEETNDDEAAIRRCFARVYSRFPTPAETKRCLAHWRDIEAILGAPPPYFVARLDIQRDAVEENTGEKFSFQEKLHAYADFVPDLQPADVALHTRALADVCLALFNSNEFAYVY